MILEYVNLIDSTAEISLDIHGGIPKAERGADGTGYLK
jgi:hypothetical protein